MILLDTDTLTLYFAGHPRVIERIKVSEEVPVTSIISRIEVLQGRFDSVVKAADGDQLLRAQERLAIAEQSLAKFTLVEFTTDAASEFDRLRPNKKLKKIGRKDLLIACIALAHRATLVTRNRQHFQHVPGLRLEDWAG
jgi:predicted nucleic acid-binding protein